MQSLALLHLETRIGEGWNTVRRGSGEDASNGVY